MRTLYVSLMKTFIPVGCLVLLSLFSGLNFADDVGANTVISSSEAVNIAGRQRMLTQRITKAYLLIGSDIEVEKAKEQRDQAIALFTKQLAMLKVFAPVGHISDQLTVIDAEWKEFRSQVMSEPNKSDASRIVNLSESLLAKCHQVVQDIVKVSGIEAAEMVNISGRQRMLTQMIAKLYTSQYWGVEVDAVDKKLKQFVGEFELALEQLMVADVNTDEISYQLERVQNQWKFSKIGFERSLNSQEYVPLIIAATMESILLKMENIVKLYEVESNKIGQNAVVSNL